MAESITLSVAIQTIRSLRRTGDAPRRGRATGIERCSQAETFAGNAEDRNFEHLLIDGPSGCGKTEWWLKAFFGLNACNDGVARVLIDGDGRGAKKVAIKSMQYGRLQSGLAVYDEYRLVDHGIGVDFFEKSVAESPQRREAENREIIALHKTIYVRAEDELDTAKTVMIDEVFDDVLSFILENTNAVEITDLLYVFAFDSPIFQKLYDGCTNSFTKFKFDEYRHLAPAEKERKLTPVRRRIEKLVRCIQLRNRSVPTMDLVSFLNMGGWYIANAGSEGDLGREDASKLSGLLIILLINWARTGRLKRKVIVIIDEGVGLKIIDRNIARALDMARKWGLMFVLVIFSPFALPEEVRIPVMNIRKKIIFMQPDPDAAHYFARILAIRQLKIETKYTTHTTRSVEDGYEVIPTTSRGIAKYPTGKHQTETHGQTIRTKRRDVEEIQEHPYTFEEIILKKQGEVMNMDVGEFEIASTNYVSSQPQQFTMLEMPWENLYHPGPPRMPLAEYKLKKLMESLYATNPAYQLKLVNYPQWTPIKRKDQTGTPSPQSGTQTSNGSRRNTPLHQNRLSKLVSSAAKPRQGNGSGQANGKGKSNGSHK
jgi:hypothetical protein